MVSLGSNVTYEISSRAENRVVWSSLKISQHYDANLVMITLIFSGHNGHNASAIANAPLVRIKRVSAFMEWLNELFNVTFHLKLWISYKRRLPWRPGLMTEYQLNCFPRLAVSALNDGENEYHASITAKNSNADKFHVKCIIRRLNHTCFIVKSPFKPYRRPEIMTDWLYITPYSSKLSRKHFSLNKT